MQDACVEREGKRELGRREEGREGVQGEREREFVGMLIPKRPTDGKDPKTRPSATNKNEGLWESKKRMLSKASERPNPSKEKIRAICNTQ